MSRRTLWIAVGLLFVAAAGLWAARLTGGSAQNTATIGGPFALTDAAGKTRTDAEFRGKYLLIFFGYTNCPDVCPTTLASAADALSALGPDAARVQSLFITVDPARDTPDVVGRYTAQFSPELLGLTGTPAQIAAVAHAYRVYYADHRTADGAAGYAVDHSSFLYLMGPDGRFIAPIDGTLDGADIAARLRGAMRGVA